MKQHTGKKKKDKVAIVLMLCFCLIALTSIFTVKASLNKISESRDNVPVTKNTPTASAKKPAAQKEEQPEEGKEAAETVAEVPVVDSRSAGESTRPFICPINPDTGKIAKGYSMDTVVYNLTLDQYMTHPGIDIEAPAGTPVKAAAEGTVTAVGRDDAYGTTIEITHSDGYISRYCNLATDKLVEKGDTVTQGQTISNVGKTALYESKDPAHLHFELLKDGKPCDPADLLR